VGLNTPTQLSLGSKSLPGPVSGFDGRGWADHPNLRPFFTVRVTKFVHHPSERFGWGHHGPEIVNFV